MTTIQSKLGISLTILSGVLFVFTARNTIAQPQLSKKEAKALNATAKTREDHLKLAEYYKAEAERLEADAKDHDEMGEMYRKKPTPMAVKHPDAIGEGHCHEMARRSRESANRARELATMHEQMAAQDLQKQP